jgi:CHAD domain-containing protein
MAKAPIAGLEATTQYRAAIGKIIEYRFNEMMRHLPGTLAGRDPEELHQMRVASRRLRAAMDVSTGCFPSRFQYFHKTVKTITDVLGNVRDCDVMREALLAHRDSRPKEEHPALNAMLHGLRLQRDEAREQMITFFQKLEAERFDVRFRGFVAEHTLG